MDSQQHSLLVEHKKLGEHFREVLSFHATREKMRKKISRAMVAITTIALIGNLAQAVTIAVLVPLTRIVPVYLWVRQDGTIDSSISMSRLPPTQSMAVVEASLWEYVRLREGYSADTAQYAYDVVSAYSAPKVAAQYQSWFNYPNNESPQVTIGKRGSVTITHISSSNIEPLVQQVRFSRTVKLDGHQPIVTTMTATIGYATVNKLPSRTRLTNPGGVVVTSYQVSEDTPK